jgi:DNA-binding NtrC family response regulator
VPIILIGANAIGEATLTAVKATIHEHSEKPFSPEELLRAIERQLSSSSFRKKPPKSPDPTAGELIEGRRLIGESPSTRDLRAFITKLSSVDTNVLITGETGTGKELVAELIQKNSLRRLKPFVCINCAAIPDSLLESELFGYERGAFTGAQCAREGKLELADGGTVFFDEIGDMSPYAQAKILRVIESKEVQRLGGKRSIRLDVSIIAATNQDLDAPAAELKFRRDLFFRLNVARIHLLPLRERKTDIPLLLDHYIQAFNHQFGREVEAFTDPILPVLLRYDWPGNIRELKNVLEAAFVNLPAAHVSLMDLPQQLRHQFMSVAGVPPTEQDLLLSALWSTDWNKSKAARQLHWSRMTLYRRMARYQLVEKEQRKKPPEKAVVQNCPVSTARGTKL